MRFRVFEIIEKAESRDSLSLAYDIFMIIVIFISVMPLTEKEPNTLMVYLDLACASIFVIDYFLRLITADYKLHKGKLSFLIYFATPMAIVDLLAILPSFGTFFPAFNMLRAFRILKVLRLFKAFRYSKNFILISNVIKRNKSILSSIILCAIFFVIASALFIFTIEPHSFDNFFEAVYWAMTALTTVGYGDIYPVTDAGRFISMISSFFGIAMVALPSGVITAAFINEISQQKLQEQNMDNKEDEEDIDLVDKNE